MTVRASYSSRARAAGRAAAVVLVGLSLTASARLCSRADYDSRSIGGAAVCEALRGQHGPARTLARQALRRHPGSHASLTWRAVEALAAGNPELHDALVAPDGGSTAPAVDGFTTEGLRWLRAQLAETGPDCTHAPEPTNR